MQKNTNYKNITTNQTNNKIKGTGKHKKYKLTDY